MFYKIYLQGAIANLIKKKLLGDHAKLVLFTSLVWLNKQNMIIGSPKALREQLDMSQHSFDLGIQELKNKNIMRKYTKKEYMINPNFVYYGDEQSFHVLKYMWDTQTTKGLRK